jgi:formylglycine-generating enzyme required for sulfatase activity
VEITQGQGSGLSANGVLFYMVSVDGISATLTSFNIGMHEVTQSLWEAVMGTVISTTYGEGANYPVYNVSWNDIVGTSGSVGYTVNGTSYRTDGFYYKLSQLVGGGKQFRLPTEWEWEYAAKGGQQTHNYTYSGSNTIGDVAWYGENIPNYGTQVVGSKQANELGIYDMSGNVGEWCSGGDPYYSYIHVHRGGSWRSNAAGCAVADRSGYPASGIGFNYVGFRVVLSLP